MTISDVNALLYKPGHPADRLERALCIPALSAGWHGSFEALLERTQSTGATSGNPGLAPATGPPAAWTGFRPMRVTGKKRESGSVTSLLLEPTDGHPLTPGLPGQFIVLRLRPTPDAPPLLRSYSLSGEPSNTGYRVYAVNWLTFRVSRRYRSMLSTTIPAGRFVHKFQPGGLFTENVTLMRQARK
jgi:hypothetical protein